MICKGNNNRFDGSSPEHFLKAAPAWVFCSPRRRRRGSGFSRDALRTGGATAAVIPAWIPGHKGQAVKDSALGARRIFGLMKYNNVL
jgi:hypothetical protein